MKDKIRAIYDNGGETIDRYTVILEPMKIKEGTYAYLGLSDNPEHPQSFSQFGECKLGDHLGEETSLEDLPPHIVEHIKRRLEE